MNLDAVISLESFHDVVEDRIHLMLVHGDEAAIPPSGVLGYEQPRVHQMQHTRFCDCQDPGGKVTLPNAYFGADFARG